jgi:hypothetical protein
MSLGKRKHKSEHTGAKNGGGHWGHRAEAKQVSRKQRRSDGQALIQNELARIGACKETKRTKS